MKHANTTWLAGFVALAIAWGSTAALAQHQHGAQKAVAPASAAKPARKPDEKRQDQRRSNGPDEGNRKGGKRPEKPAVQSRPPRPEKPIDPDNPFAALMALKLRN